MEKRYEREIIDNFPYPIAACFTRLRTRQCKQPSYERLNHIFITAERISRYLASIVISECRAHMEIHAELVGQCPLLFVEHIKNPSWGNWVRFIREGLIWLHQQQVDLIMPELHDFWFNAGLKPTKAVHALDVLVNIRNDNTAHHLSGLHDNEYPPLCEDTWEKLTIILEALAFLPHYELRFMHKIAVHNIRRRPLVYLHEYSSARGANDDFEADDESKSNLLESEATFLVDPQTRRYLNLEPLMVYEEDAGIAADVFFYKKMSRPENARYAACKKGGKFSLKKKNSRQNTQRREYMIEEWQHLLNLFSLHDKS